ncbi:MAG TPA: pteridine-dependent deoxygenase [Rhodanobacteraceae bacterium]|nr:pteridine-dependent deoxygenase [Rhodanobacteraceae bacterium]
MSAPPLARLSVRYQQSGDFPDGALAQLSFGDHVTYADARCLRVPLQPIGDSSLHECWEVEARTTHGEHGPLRWSAGGGWLFIALELHEAAFDGIEAAAEHAYRRLCEFVAAREERHLLRIWNYLHAINEGAGDGERYRRFCIGRARGLAAHGIERYPAATAIGHGASGLLQIYALCASQPGVALENPRQISAWRYPREYGPTPPSFARAMKLPGDGLAISGTAAVVGHASCHERDLEAQISETCANLYALLESAALPALDRRSPLKIYLRHAEDTPALQAALAKHLDPEVPRVILLGDICRRELLVEIDGWSGLPRSPTAGGSPRAG